MKIFVSGVCGFIASNLANKLHELGYHVYGVDNLQFGYSKNLSDSMDHFYEVLDFSEVN